MANSFLFIPTDSLTKVLPWEKPERMGYSVLRGAGGQILSFQLAYPTKTPQTGFAGTFSVQVTSDFPVTLRKVELVPCRYPCHGEYDADYLTTRPGLLPDLLRPVLSGEKFRPLAGQWGSLWIDISLPDMEEPSDSPLILKVLGGDSGEELAVFPFTIRHTGHSLPPQKLLHTEWFHADCLADYYRVPVFSEEHWKIIDQFMESAAAHGISLLLTPVFTPPLDTPVGLERPTVQLVDVEDLGGAFRFGFGKLDRWLSLCEKNNIPNIEISHLFTQWGALAAPKIVALREGKLQRIFGWDTPAVGDYTSFLHAFLPELKKHLAEKGWLDRTIFHISDEPREEHLEGYLASKRSVENLLSDCRVIDALSSYQFYEMGAVKLPVVSLNHLPEFTERKVPHLWTYYCTAQYRNVSNRFIAMPSGRTRILGVLLYLYRVEGFLQWGFNFYYDHDSRRILDPFQNTDADGFFPSGDPFLVYPGPEGTPLESIRGAVIRQALYDLRLLELAEARASREQVVKAIYAAQGSSQEITVEDYPTDSAFFHSLTEKLYELLA